MADGFVEGLRKYSWSFQTLAQFPFSFFLKTADFAMLWMLWTRNVTVSLLMLERSAKLSNDEWLQLYANCDSRKSGTPGDRDLVVFPYLREPLDE